MPQMMPLNWLILYFFFMFLIFLMVVILNYLFLSLSGKVKMIILKKNSFNWMW